MFSSFSVVADELVSIEQMITLYKDVGSKFSFISDKKLIKKYNLTSSNSLDYFQTPVEMEKRLEGDCEDFAIYFYYRLIELGLKKSQMYFLSGASTLANGQSHMVLLVKAHGLNIIFDNMSKRLYEFEGTKFIPLLAFNESELATLSKGSGDTGPVLAEYRFQKISNNYNYGPWKKMLKRVEKNLQ